MKTLIFNGSPRKGNTCVAIDAVIKGMDAAGGFEIDVIEADNVSVSGCIACMNCGCVGNCVFDDDTNDIIDAVEAADAIIFATPVYWWGMTAQLKLIVDKFYCRFEKLATMPKKVGVIVIGESEQDDPQYKLIPKQFECICEYLGWDMLFAKTYTAGEAGVLAQDEDAVAELEGLYDAFL